MDYGLCLSGSGNARLLGAPYDMGFSVPSLLRFADFEVDLRAGRLRRHGVKIRLQEQPFKVLTALLESSGEVVTREELRSRLWPADTFVDFDHRLAAAISKLREALNDSAENPRFVETVGRRGYRFMMPLEPVTAAAEVIPLQSGREPPDAPPAQRKSTWWRPASMSVGVALLLVVVFFVLRRSRQSDVPASAAPRISSIAVLPLENLSNDAEQEYFVEGVTDEIITDLAKLPGIRVISRTSAIQYKGTHKTCRKLPMS